MMPRPPCPERVWVAAMVVTSEVLMREGGQINGGLGALFAPRVLEAKTTARICGVATSEAEARKCLDDWKARNPGVQGEEVVEQVPFGSTDEVLVNETPQNLCAGCAVPLPRGHWCPSCTEKRNAALRAEDPELVDAIASGRKLGR